MKITIEVDDRDYTFELDEETLIHYQTLGIDFSAELKQVILENKNYYSSSKKQSKNKFGSSYKSYLKRKDFDTVLKD